ncbi:hypothetical protein ACFFNY_33050 [Paenibacillus hodogayensis]|uniref:NodB homology domain-containing protein n=1 Tax=Paenibacillus hodogayensis TaxID=279208 RepID=A0ABV5W766_9BACL
MIHLIWNERQADEQWSRGEDVYASYWPEILKQAGMAYRRWSPEAWLESRPQGITIVAGLDQEEAWNDVMRAYCESGNAVLAIGDTYGLDDVLGADRQRSIEEGWIGWGESSLADGLRSSFHFFGATLVNPAEGTASYGAMTLPDGNDTAHPVVTVKTYSRGAASLLAIDLARTFCLIQQGVPVVKDGEPAPDGTGGIDDGVLKADDGILLNWERDRGAVDGGAPFYIDPLVDEFRILFVRLIHRLTEAISRTFAQTWFWPEGIEAIGHISHDTDGSSPEAAELLLGALAESGVRSSWCVIMPGYPERIYRRIAAEGHELALHYNALESDGFRWDETLFREQLDMLKGQLSAIGESLPIRTNKNHYLRWEGGADLYHWCERTGIVMEQSKGGTKQGNKGFLMGTCHPYVPMAEAGERNRLMSVYSNPTLAWDPPAPLRCTMPEAKALVDRSKDVYGVAHFLYHPASFLLVKGVHAAFVELVKYAKDNGFVWWTALELYEWLELRRTVDAYVEDDCLRIVAGRACSGLTVLLGADAVVPAGEAGAAVRSACAVIRYGIPLQQWILDVPQGETRISLRGAI